MAQPLFTLETAYKIKSYVESQCQLTIKQCSDDVSDLETHYAIENLCQSLVDFILTQ